MELEEEHAVPEVEQAGGIVALQFLALLAKAVQRDVHRVLAHRLVLFADRAKLELPAVLGLVEALVAAFEHLLYPGADLDAQGLHPLHGLPDPQEVPGAEGAGLVGEAPLHRVVCVLEGVADLWQPPRGVGHVREEGVPDVPRVTVLFGPIDEEAQPGPEVALLLRLGDDGHVGVFGGAVLEGFEVEHVEDGLAVALVALVEAGAGLVAEEVLLLHLLELGVGLEVLARLVLRDGLVEVLGDADGDVEADGVVEAEGRGLGVPDKGPRDRVDLLYGVAVLEGVGDGLHPGEGAEAVPYKVRGVLGDHTALAEHPLAEVPYLLDDLLVGLPCRDDLQQLQVARRVEEVRPEKTPPERLRAAFRYLVQRDAARVRRDDGVLFRERLDPLGELPFGFQLLQNGLEHPIGLGDAFEVVVEVAGADALGYLFGHERRRAGLDHPVVAAPHDGVLVFTVFGGYVEQVHLEPGVGAVGGDGGAHGAGAEHGHPPDAMRHPLPL